ncbi:MAG: formylglycine-rating enzyme [Chthoniobacter sp.]|jgi:sulfatase modifying factor 1|nr:formylglycine-rating enzyme [Chthoniobacter sp.]
MKRGLLALALLPAAVLAAEPPAVTDGPNGHRLVAIPAGTYALGRAGCATNPPHRVELRAFRIADAETTNAQFAAFVEATGYVTDAEKRGMGKTFHEGMADWAWKETEGANWRRPAGPHEPKAAPDHPVTQISGEDALAYCRWLGARLPTCDEWEAAARAGAATLYPWGDKFDPTRANIWNGKTHEAETREDGFTYTAPVRSFPANAWGLHDVVGNVFEYCADLPPAYRQPEAQAARFIAGRGGSWWCSVGTCHFFNLADIGRMDRHGSLANQGFRVALEAVATK